MDNKTPQQNEPTDNDQAEPVNQTVTPNAGFGVSSRVIQPLDPNLKVDNTPTRPTHQPVNPVQGQTTNTDIRPTDTTTQPLPPIANPNSIYPEATRDMRTTNYQTPGAANQKEDTVELHNFSNGYSIGGSIFWFQLLAGTVLGLILLGIDSIILRTANLSVIAIVSLLYYLVGFFIIAYVPYNTLKSNNIEESFWLTIFGVAIQSIIVGSLFELLISLIIRTIINHNVPSSLIHNRGAGLEAIAIGVYIGFLIASYFLTKLSWGIAFSLFGKIKNKLVVKTIGIGIIAIIISGLVYHYLRIKNV